MNEDIQEIREILRRQRHKNMAILVFFIASIGTSMLDRHTVGNLEKEIRQSQIQSTQLKNQENNNENKN